MAQVIGTVIKLVGQAYAQEGGAFRELKLGDDVYQGETIVTGNGAIVEIETPDAPPILLAGDRRLLLSSEVTVADRDTAVDSAIGLDDADQILAVLEGDGDLLESLEAAAAGAGGDNGSSFVRLGRVGFSLPEQAADPASAAIQAQEIFTSEPLLQATVVNNPPDAVDDLVTTEFETPVNGSVLPNDSDPDGDDLTITANTQPNNGTLTFNPDGTFTYVPNAGFSGQDTFTYTITDGNGGTDTATVRINVGDIVILSIVGPDVVQEGDTTTNYELRLVDGTGQPVTAATDITVVVTYTGTATDGTDYTSETPFVIAAGASSVTFDLATIDDAYADNGETMILTISTSDDGGFEALTLGTDSVTTTIIDDSNPDTPETPDEPDQDAVVLSIGGPATVAEGATTTDYTLSLVDKAGNPITAATDITVVVTYTGTATDGTDYTLETPFVIAAGASSVTFDLATIDDAYADNGETMILTISTSDNGGFEALTLGTDSVTTTIIDDSNPDTPETPDEPDQDAVVLSIGGPATVAEGATTTDYTLSLVDKAGNPITAATDITVVVTYTGTATDGTDYTLETPFVIAAGASSVTFDLATIDDAYADNGETMILTISTSDNGGFEALTLGTDSVTTTIIDDSNPDTPETPDEPDQDAVVLSIGGPATVAEGATTTDYTLSLVDKAGNPITAATDITVVVTYTGTATDGTDYTLETPFVIAAGASSVTFDLATIDDAYADNGETMILTISTSDNGGFEALTLGTDSVTTTIIDDSNPDTPETPDEPDQDAVVLSIGGPATVAEGATTTDYTLSLVDKAGNPITAATDITVVVTYTGTATDGTDYTLETPFVIAAGASSVTFDLATIDDAYADNGETMILTISTSDDGGFEALTLGTDSVTTTIIDDSNPDTPETPDEPDQDAVVLSIGGPATVAEGATTTDYTLSLVDKAGNPITAATDITVVVTYTGTATDGTDYTLETPFVIAAGASSVTFDLATIDDAYADNGETMILTISTSDNGGFEALTLGTDSVTTTIIDDSNPDTPETPDEPDQDAVVLSIGGPATVAEGATTTDYTLSLVDKAGNPITAATDITVVVTYTGTATDGTDYTLETPFVIAAGASSVTFDLATIDDAYADNGETMILTISTSDNGGFEALTLGTDSVTTTIIDDSNPDTPETPDEPDQDAVVLSIGGPATVAEGATTTDYTLSLVDKAGNPITAATDITVVVTYTGTATDGTDYTLETPFVIAAGASSVTFDLATIDDAYADNGETMILTISTSDNGGFEALTLGTDSVTTTIIDDSNPDTPETPDEPDQDAVVLSIGGPATVAEGATTTDYTLSLVDKAGNPITAATDITVVVTYTGTATDGTDYTLETPFVIAAGASSVTFDLATIDDAYADNGETMILTISTSDNGGFEALTLGTDSVTTTIIDDSNPDTPETPDEPDQDAVVLSIGGPATVAEGATTTDYTLSLVDKAGNPITAATDITVVVTYTGTATDGTDYTLETPFVIAAGASSVTFDLATIDDAYADNGETMILTISTSDNGGFEALTLGTDSVTTTIIDDSNPDTPETPDEPDQDAVVLSIGGPATVAEGATTTDYTLSLVDKAGNPITAATDITVVVTYTGTATDGTDYTLETPFVIAAGASSVTFDLATIDDAYADNGETMILTISTSDDGGFEALTLGTDSVTTTIIDDSNPDTPETPDEPDQDAVVLSIGGPATVAEGATTTDYTLSLVDKAGNPITAATDITVVVTYTGTATDGTDYTLETPFVIAAGASSVTFDLATIDDAYADNGETMILTISTSDNGGFEALTLGTDSVTTTIIDDSNPDTPETPDEPDQDAVVLSIGGPATVAEGATTTDYTLSLVDKAGNPITAATDITVVVTYTGTATDGTDYTLETPFVIAAGASSVTFDLATIDDAYADNGETMILTISTSDNGGFEALTLGTDSVTTTIIDDSNPDTPETPDEPDQDAVVLSIGGPATVAEGATTTDYTLSLVDKAGNPITAATDITVVVTYTGTATDGTDYTLETPFVIAAGASSVTFDLATIDDAYADNGETMILTISTSDNGGFEALTLGTDSVTTTIIDDSNPDTPETPDEPDQDAVVLSIGGPATVAEGATTTDYTLSLVDKAGNPITAATDITVVVTYTGTATDGTDYTLETPFVIAAGASSVTFDLATIDDAYADNGETMILTISTSDNGGFEALTLGTDSVTTTIIDDSNPDTPETPDEPDQDAVVLSIGGPATVAEGATTTDYTLSLVDKAGNPITAATDITVVVTYTGTATDGTDYTLETPFVIAAGASSVTFDLATIDDAYADNGETMILTISTSDNGGFEALTLGTDSVTTTIIDDSNPDTPETPDEPDQDAVVLSIGGPATVAEGATTTDYTLSLVDKAGNPITAATDITVVVTYTGTATDGTDYTLETPFVIAAGASSVTFDLATIDDAYADNGETMILTISTSDNGGFEALTLGTDSVTTTIIDDSNPDTPETPDEPDQETATVTLAADGVSEADSITVTAEIDIAPETDLVLTLNNGSTITILAGATTGSVTFANPNQDDPYIDPETLTYSIASSTGGNYEDLDTTSTVDVNVTDTVDTSTVTLSSSDVVEGADVTVTATVDNAPETDLVLTLNNGSTITILAGATTGSVTFANPNQDDPYIDPETLTYSIASSTGGNYEDLDTTSTVDVNVTDTVDTSTVTLSSSDVVEGADVTVTATVDNAPETDLVLTLNNGSTITILAGATTGSVTFASSFVSSDTNVTFAVSSYTGGNYEDLDTSDTTSITVSDVPLTASASDIVSDDADLNTANTTTINASGGSGGYTFDLQTEHLDPPYGYFEVDANTGVVSFTQTAAFSHDLGSDYADDVAMVEVVVTDSSGASTVVTVNVDIIDDLPASLIETGPSTNPVDGSNISVSGTLSFDAGADGAGSIVFSGGSDGDVLTDANGQQIYMSGQELTLSGFGTDTLSAETSGGTVALTIEIAEDGAGNWGYTITPVNGTLTPNSVYGTIDFDGFSGGNASPYVIIDSFPDSTLDVVITSLVNDSNGKHTVNTNDNLLGAGAGQNVDFDGTTGDTVTFAFQNDVSASGNGAGFVVTQGPAQTIAGISIPFDAVSANATFTIVTTNTATGESATFTFAAADLLPDPTGTYDGYLLIDTTDTGFVFDTVSVTAGSDDGGTSTFKIGQFGVLELGGQESLDFEFEITGADGDGDTITSTLDFTLSPSTAPIAIDLDGDGVEYLSREAGVVFTDTVTNESVNTAWVGPDDGLLVIDANGSGTVDETREYVFTEWSDTAETDLAAVAEVFDTNQDGVLDAQDAQWEQFGIWQDLNSDGVTDANELVSLTELGVESIELSYREDSTEGSEADGDVVIHGQASVNWADGTTTTAEDTSFAIDAADVIAQEDDIPLPEADKASPMAGSGAPQSDTATDTADMAISLLEADLLIRQDDDTSDFNSES